MAEELWQEMNSKLKDRGSKFDSIHVQAWPTYDERYLEEAEVVIAVQVNGRMRETITVQSANCKLQSYVEALAKKSGKVGKFLEGRVIRKVIYVPGKILNFVVGEKV